MATAPPTDALQPCMREDTSVRLEASDGSSALLAMRAQPPRVLWKSLIVMSCRVRDAPEFTSIARQLHATQAMVAPRPKMVIFLLPLTWSGLAR